MNQHNGHAMPRPHAISVTIDRDCHECRECHGRWECMRTSIADIRETTDRLLAPALAYAEAPPARRRLDDLTASLQVPVDLATSGWVCKVLPADPGGFTIAATRPPGDHLPTITATGQGPTWCDAVSELAYALHARIDRLERNLERDELQEAA